MMFSKKALLFSVALLSFSTLPAYADDSADIKALQEQLQQAVEMIQKQSDQVSALQNKIEGIQKHSTTDNKRISAIKEDLQAASMANIRPAAGSGLNIELVERIEELEDQVFELDDKVGSRTIANAFDASRFDIGGFINTAFTHVEGEDGSASAWNRQNFELLIRADLNDQWSAFFAGGWLREGNVSFDDNGNGTLNEAGERRDPDFIIQNGAEGGTNNPQIIAWANYKHNDALNLRLGRMITPHGIINIEHFPNVLLDQEQPLFLRPFGGQTIFPNFTTGLQAHGQLFYGDDTLSYHAYSAAAQNAPEELIHGGRVAYNFGDEGFTVGLNAAFGSRSEAPNSGDYTLFGADLLVDRGSFLWKNEIFATDEENAPGRLGFYTQPAWEINDKWTVFYRYDFLDDGANGIAAVPDNAGDVTENMIGVNFLPVPNVRTRLTATRREFGSTGSIGSADADIYQFSATYSF